MRTVRRTIASSSLALLVATGAWASPTQAGWWAEVHGIPAPHPMPEGAPAAVVHAPHPPPSSAPLHVVVFLHGWNGCARVIAHGGPTRCHPGGPVERGWNLAGRHDEAETPTVLVVPQLAFRTRDGSPGRFAEPAFGKRFFGHVMKRALPGRSMSDVASLTLVAHSAGFETALTLAEVGDLPRLRTIVLLDALYSGEARFAAWLRESRDRRLISVHGDRGQPRKRSRILAKRLARQLGADAVTTLDARDGWHRRIGGHRLSVVRTRAPHGAIPRRHLAEALRGLFSASRPR